MTSHPKDLSDDLIEAMADCRKGMQSSASAAAVRKQPYPEENEPALYKGRLSCAGEEDPGKTSGNSA